MIGALDEAAMTIANAEEPEREEAEVRIVVLPGAQTLTLI